MLYFFYFFCFFNEYLFAHKHERKIIFNFTINLKKYFVKKWINKIFYTHIYPQFLHTSKHYILFHFWHRKHYMFHFKTFSDKLFTFPHAIIKSDII